MYKNYEKLRDSKGLTNYKVAKEAGVSQATLSDWKLQKSTPNVKFLRKLSEYFEVPIEYFTDGDLPSYYTNNETVKIAQEIFENKELRALFSAARDATPEDLKTTYQMLLALKRKEKDT